MKELIEKIEVREPLVIYNDGLKLFGVLHRPVDIKKPPIVVIFHGFASNKCGSGGFYVKLSEHLSRQGFASLRFDFRGCGDSEGSLDRSSLDDLISDAMAVMKYASELDGVDGNKLGLFGSSIGGSIAIESAAKNNLARAIAVWSPVASGELWLQDFFKKNPEKNVQHCLDIALKTYNNIKLTNLFREQFGRLFAYKTLASISDIPFLHMQGDKDDINSLVQQEAFKKTAGPKSQFVIYPEAQHSVGFSSVFSKSMIKIIKFFQEHLI